MEKSYLLLKQLSFPLKVFALDTRGQICTETPLYPQNQTASDELGCKLRLSYYIFQHKHNTNQDQVYKPLYLNILAIKNTTSSRKQD